MKKPDDLPKGNKLLARDWQLSPPLLVALHGTMARSTERSDGAVLEATQHPAVRTVLGPSQDNYCC